MQGFGPEQILFNELAITDINFFDFSSDAEVVNTIRENVAIWYYALRNLAIGLLLVMLIYVGIRMALSTVASEEAKYKSMLKDWVVSFVLVFLLQYIIIFTINANNGLVSIMQSARENVMQDSFFENIINAFEARALALSFTTGLGSTIVFCILVGMTLSFLIFYIKRMLTVGFLIIISPIVTVTYSIDRMGDNKSQALDKWLKEFVYNILIQPFQCLIYLIFAISAMDLMKDYSLGSAVLGIIMILFIHQAEDIVRSIFSFEHAHSLGNALTTMALASTVGKAIGDINKAKGENSGNAKAAGPVNGGASGGSGGSGGAGGAGGSGGSGKAPGKNGSGGGSGGGQTGRPQTGVAGKVSNAKNAVLSKGQKAKARAARLRSTPAGKFIGANAKLAAMIAGAAIGAGAAGFSKGAFAGGALGMGVGKLAGGAWKNMEQKQLSQDAQQAHELQEKLKEPESKAAEEYQKWAEDTGLDKDDPAVASFRANRIAKDLIDGKDPNDFSDEDKAFAKSLNDVKNTLIDSGVPEDQLESRMSDTISRIQSGDIKPPSGDNDSGT